MWRYFIGNDNGNKWLAMLDGWNFWCIYDTKINGFSIVCE